MPTQKLTNEIVAAAILGFEEQKRQIDEQLAELRSLFSGGSSTVATPASAGPTKRKRRRMSAAGRKAIAEAQRKRWAAAKGRPAPAAAKTAKPKRKLSAAGKAAIVAALKKRWAAKRAEAGKK